MIDALTGRHIWAERYNRDLQNLFALQDEITMKILSAIRVKLAVGDGSRLGAKATENLEAYLKTLQAVEITMPKTEEGYVISDN